MVTSSSLVVYDFVPTAAGNGKNALLSKEELLSKGRDLVATAESRDGWRTISPPSDLSACLGHTFVLKKTPPSPSSFWRVLGRKRIGKSTKEWGAISDTRDRLDLSKLKDFEGTDFSYLIKSGKSTRKLPARVAQVEKQHGKGKGKRTSEEQDDDFEQRQKKRRRIADATLSLHDLISQPHHHPYLPVASHQRSNLDITNRFPPYSKTPFLPIAPFSPSQAGIYFKDPYARSAWVIPVKDKLPWREATPARLVDISAISAPQSSQVPATPPSVTWTPFVINKFWSDLLEIRKREVLGAISLSFHVAPSEKPQVKITKTTNQERTPARKTIEPPPTNPLVPESLDECSYVKVYHDVQYAMHVRSVLDAWRTEVEVSETTVAPGQFRKIKMRPLQGAKLILLDETGKAVGVC